MKSHELINLLGEAVLASQLHSDFQKDLASGVNIQPDDPRYEPFIGKWNGYAAPEQRWVEFHTERRRLRTAAVAAYRKYDSEAASP